MKAPAPRYLGPAEHTSAGSNKPIHRIVLHSTVSSCAPGQAEAVARYFRHEQSGGSAHYVVDPREVVQVVYDGVIAWHAPPNAHSIGIEMCDMPSRLPGRWAGLSHRKVLQSTAKLVAQLALAYNVPIHKLTVAELQAGKRGICGHVDVSQAFHQSSHWDPGYFPWARFLRLVRKNVEAMS